MLDTLSPLLAAEEGRRVLLVASLLVLPLGCGEPTGPFATLAVTTTSLPNATPGVAYSEKLVATGGDGNYTWSVPVGSLPTGLILAANGGFKGTPSGPGSTFSVEVASRDGQTATQALSITVDGTLVLQPSDLCSDHPDAAIATFVEAELEARVRAALSVGAGEDLTCGLLGGLAQLVATSAGITSLAGVQNLMNLFQLELANNSITDVSLLRDLTNLTNLGLGSNSITDGSPLGSLTRLIRLELFNNSISDVSLLGGLTSLRYLRLENTAISDISILGGLTSLTSLFLSENAITDVSALSGITSLTTLTLGANSITDVGPLGGLTSLTFLTLGNNSITDISALAGLTDLVALWLNDNPIADIGPLSGLTSLISLRLDSNSITDVSALRGLTSLNYLALNNNPNLIDIQPLLDNPGLETLPGPGPAGVDLRSTSVSCADIAALEANRVYVISDCP